MEIAKQAIEKAKIDGRDLVIIDTAGRLHIDENFDGRITKHQRQSQIQAKSYSLSTQ